jgi:two-component system CheB/CheR fusion protein
MRGKGMTTTNDVRSDSLPGGGVSEPCDPILAPELDRLLGDLHLDPQAGAQLAQMVHREVEGRRRAEEALRQALVEAEDARQTLRQKEAALRETEERFHAVCDHARAAFGILDGMRLVYANPHFAELTGYSIEEIVGMDFRQMTHPSFHQLMIDRARQRLAGEPVPDHYEFLAVTKSGQERWVDFSPAITELNGKRVIIGTGFDVTERKQAEEALRESERRFRGTFENAAVGIAHVDTEGHLLLVNQKLCEILGCQGGELVGRSFAELTAPEDREPAVSRFAALMRGEIESYAVEGRHLRKDEQWIWVLVTQSVQRDEAGRPIYSIAIVQDITRRKEAEAAMERAKRAAEQAQAQAEEANTAKDHFLAVLSHELRTPLTPALTMVSMLHQDPRLDEDTRDGMDMIRRNVEMEARLIDDLLDMTRIARGKVELHKQQVALCTVIRRAVQVCQPDLEGRRLHFGLDLGDGAPYLIEADVGRLQQVFWNLLKNAIKFTADGGGVGVRCRRDGAENCVVVEVNDSGVGIEPEALGRIFNAFEQAGRSVTRQFGGLGLGLAISKALVELHGGTIEAHSPGKGQGATFRVRLPVVVAQPQAQAPPAATPSAAGALRILLVEDHGGTARAMRHLLMREGHMVEKAADVATALELCHRQRFDLLISDLGLPDRSGVDLIRELRACGCTLPAIALSGYGQEEDIRRCQQAGFATHLTKPTSPDKLTEAIAAVTGAPGRR